MKTILKKTTLIIILILCISIPTASAEWFTSEFGGRAKVEDPPGTHTWYSRSFGGEVEVTDDSWSNREPTFSGEAPTGEGIDLTPLANVTINDQDGNATTIDWYNSTDNISWTHFSHFTGHEANTSNSSTCSFADTYSTKYYLKVTANDTHDNNTKYWNFTTLGEPGHTWHSCSFGGTVNTLGTYPTIISIDPANESTDILMRPRLTINITEPNGQNFNITWSTNATTWVRYNTSCTDGNYSQVANWANTSETTYWFTVAINDTEGNWKNETFHFTIAEYQWTMSSVFTIGKTSDCDLDLNMNVNNTDLDTLLSYYLTTTVGEWDINEDGIVDYLDRSLIQNRLGENYG